MSATFGAIIAGGQGQRLGGVRKAHLKLGGVRLLDRVVARLGVDPANIIVAIGQLPVAAFAADDFALVPDLTDTNIGPLAGLAAAVDYCLQLDTPPRFLISSAVDIPFLPHDFLSRLSEEIPGHAAAFAQTDDQFYPTNTLWRLDAIATLPAQMRRGAAPKSLKQLLRDLGASPVDWPIEPNPFANINTMTELLTLSRLGN